ncbi:MAG: PhzF family phenazine biosynthesis protein [Thermoplasmata archaeon]|nr:PhzF family phenazine biosynthesis protein [Thermoplasmata archaeon]
MANVPLVLVDAFSRRPFHGNGAAVCILPRPAPVAWMQHLAEEMRQAETAFVVLRRGTIGLRWFTPVAEVALCGHATLASAHVLWEGGYRPPEELLRFTTQSGVLTARRLGAQIELDFPVDPVREVRAPKGLMTALGTQAVFVGRGRFDCLVEVETEAQVRDLAPDVSALAAFDVRGVIVTARSSRRGSEYVCRFFAPSLGIPEDPATGSIAATLGPFWAERLGRATVRARQLSSRGAEMTVEVRGARVGIAGSAVTVFRTEIPFGG